MSQRARILAHLEAGRCLNPMEALTRFGCFRLAARVGELRESGYPIQTRIVKTRTDKRIAVYRLLKQI